MRWKSPGDLRAERRKIGRQAFPLDTLAFKLLAECSHLLLGGSGGSLAVGGHTKL